MKNNLLWILGVILVLISCKNDDSGADPLLSVSPAGKIHFTAEAPTSEAKDITVTTNQDNITVLSGNDWCKIARINSTQFRITALPNNEASARNTNITISAGKAIPIIIPISQEGDDPELVRINVSDAGSLTNSYDGDYTAIQKVKISGPLNIDDCAAIILKMTALAYLDLSEAVFTGDSLPNSAFNSAYIAPSSFHEIILPINLKTISNGAFYQCENLKRITIPSSVTKIGEYAFSGCTALSGITLPGGLMQLGDYAFSRCSGLTSITIPGQIKEIEEGTFTNCTALASVVLPEGVMTIGESAFLFCESLSSINLPGALTVIGDRAFSHCSKLATVDIPSAVYSIGESAFQHCTLLKTAVIPGGVTQIKNYTFFECEALTSVTLPESITSIGISVFNNCTALTSITLPASLESIESDAFYNCSKLNNVICNATTPPSVKNYTFRNTPATKTLKVPAASVNTYKGSNWSSMNFASITAIQ